MKIKTYKREKNYKIFSSGTGCITQRNSHIDFIRGMYEDIHSIVDLGCEEKSGHP